MADDGGRTVQDGYDRLGKEYLSKRPTDGEDVAFLDHFTERLDDGSRVLDAGCGPGEPITRTLSERFEVVGVDFSREQLRLACDGVPEATFAQQDLTTLGFADESFDGIVSYYALIHVPREHDRAVLADLHRLLKPSGVALLCLGASGHGEIRDDEFMDADVELYWSTHDEETYRDMLAAVGFEIVVAERITDSLNPESDHLFVLVRKE